MKSITLTATGNVYQSMRLRGILAFAIVFAIAIAAVATSAEGQTKLSPRSVEAIDQMMTDYFPKDEPGAVAILAKDGEILYHKAFGLANLEFQIPMELKSKFLIGSISKPIVAAAILRLADEGRLSVEDNIAKHLKYYPDPENKIRIKHLLTHTSGIHNYNNFNEPHPPGYFTIDYPPREFIDLFKDLPLDFEPGTKYEYSNSGYVLLGAIIEQVSEKRFEDYLQDEFWKPLNLQSIARFEPRLVSRDLTPGYFWTGQSYLVPTNESRAFRRSCAGGIQSTAHDLLRWCDAFLANRVVKQKTRLVATVPFVLNDLSLSQTGFGWFLGNLGGSPLYAHDGLTPGHSSSLIVLPEEGIVSLILVNRNWVADDRGWELPGLPHRMAATAIGKPYGGEAATEAELRDLPAVYRTEDGKSLTITQRGNQLFSQKESGRPAPMFRFTDGSFYVERGYETVKFDSNHKPSVVTVDGLNGTKYQRTNNPLPQRSLSQLVWESYQREGSAGLKLFSKHRSSEEFYLSRQEMLRLATTLHETGDTGAALDVLELVDELLPREVPSPEYAAFKKAINDDMVAAVSLIRTAMQDQVLNERDVNRIGYSFLRRGKHKAAIAFFTANVEAFTDSWNANDSLAEAYLASGQIDLARKYYRISVKLNPENWDGLFALKKLNSDHR